MNIEVLVGLGILLLFAGGLFVTWWLYGSDAERIREFDEWYSKEEEK